MVVVIVLAAAVLFQLAAAVLTVRLIVITGRQWAWGALAAAILLMIARRCVPLVETLSGGEAAPLELSFELMGLAISVAMFVGIAAVTPLFRSLQRSNAVFQSLGGVNKAINRGNDRGRLLKAVCDSLVENHAYRHSWIGILDDAAQLVEIAESNGGEGFTAWREFLARGTPMACVRAALANSGVTAIRDVASACRDCPQSSKFCDSQVLVARLGFGDRVFGLVSAALPRRVSISEVEKTHFAEVAGDIGFALHAQQMAEERRKAEESLRLDELRLEALLRLNQMTHAPLQEITDFALEQAVRLTESRIGYLAFVNADESVMTMHAWSKTAMRECAIIDKPIVYPVVNTGLWGEAIRQRKPIITNDYAAPSPWKRGAPEGHVRVQRHMNAPVFDGDQIVIVAGVGNKTEPYDDSDVRQLTLLMQGMWQLIRRREAEDAVREARDKLEVRVEERTAELSKTADDLRAAKKAAEEASRAKSTFLANMSHEIRTPLNAIIGMTELVLNSQLNAQQREFLATVRDSGEALLSVINDILDFSRIEAGKLVLTRSTFNLWESLGDTVKSFGLKSHQQGLELAYYVHPEVPHMVVGDYNRLRQVVTNLIGNSVKFTERGEVILEVTLESLSGNEVVVHFTVSDTGIGIAPEKRAKIFEMFEQVDPSIRRRHGGTGLGLAIAARLVELMGGRIWVESEMGRGSQFHFTTRLGIAGEVPPVPASPEPASLHGLCVLVVDDNATNRRILEEILRSWHMEPSIARSGEEALRMMQEAQQAGRPYRLVLTDAHMPNIDGFRLTEQIKTDAGVASTVVMMLTSGDRPDDAARCAELGIAGYLLKPIKQSELLEAIERAMGIEVSRPVPVELAARPQVGSLNLLLAEDSIVNQKLAVALLEGQSHRVTVANNGHEAVAAAQAQRFDLILMDVQMPEMDGLEATAAIRAGERESGGHVPIIAMTAHALKGDREMCIEAGMDSYIAKPIRAKDLFDAIDKVFMPQSENAAAASCIDWKAALDAVLGNEWAMRVAMEAALEEFPRLMSAIQHAAANCDPNGLQRNAHTLKASLRYFGAQSAFQHAQDLETSASEGRMQAVPQTVATLERELAAVQSALRDYLQQNPSPPAG